MASPNIFMNVQRNIQGHHQGQRAHRHEEDHMDIDMVNVSPGQLLKAGQKDIKKITMKKVPLNVDDLVKVNDKRVQAVEDQAKSPAEL